MIRWDAEGHPHRSFLPHLLVGLLLAAGLVALGLLTLGRPGAAGAGWAGAVAGAALDPVNLLLAGVTGWLLLRHRQLLPALLLLGLVIGYGIDFVDFSDPGATAAPRQVAARLLACLGVGYLANALRLWLAPPAPRF